MNLIQTRLIAGLIATVLSLPALAAEPATSKSGVVATVNGKAIPQERFDVFLADQKSRGAPDSDEVKKMIREELIRREVIVQQAKKVGTDKKPGFQTKLDMIAQSALLAQYMDDFVKAHPVSEADLKKAYADVIAKASKKEYKARHVLVEKEDDAKAIIVKLKGGAKIADLAKDSKDPGSKDNGGDLGWNTAEAYVKPFSDAMTKLEKGKFTTEPVKTDFGYHVIQLEDVRDATPPAYDQIKPQLTQRLQQEAVQKHVAELMKTATIK
jgi:peptidyl-prolyl cis-trans isomerase C